MGGWGTEEAPIIEILANRSNSQRVELASQFKTMYGDDLVDRLKGELKGDFEETVLALMTPPVEYQARCLKAAMEGAGTSEDVLIEIMCTKNNQELEDLKTVYSEVYDDNSLEEDIESETSGHFKRLLVSLCNAQREEGGEDDVDEGLAEEDAREIYEAGEGQRGTDESKFNSVLALRSWAHLRVMFDKYNDLAGQSIDNMIDEECEGAVEDGYLAIVSCVRNLPGYFAKRINDACKGWGTDDTTLIRCIVSRSEIDLVQVKEVFEARYGRTMAEAVTDECDGDYKNMLLAIIKWIEKAFPGIIGSMADFQGTIFPAEDFDAEVDAEALHEAMKGWGTDEDLIIDVLANRSNAQRLEIREKFKQMYGEHLIDRLKSELKGDFEDVVVALLTPPIEYLARCMKSAMKGMGTDEQALIEILCTKNNQEIEELKATYAEVFDGGSLEDDIESETSGHFKRLLVSLCNAGREEGDENDVDDGLAEEDATEIYDAGEGQRGTDESKFNSVLALRSFPHLHVMFEKYLELSGNSIDNMIDEECDGAIKDGYMAIVYCVRNIPGFFAKRINDACKGLGTDDSTLIRCIVSRSEIDLQQVKEVFETRYGRPLSEAIKDECGGDYKNMLLAIVKD
ncbi:PREDICTED: annexin A6-like [Branchiostoma belcheri]|uniref:Annexin n=1 Tax=Branchiostoma belcheri TaxID=7741 RepID=A0A6P5AFH2_BRABE|nr:PREDICTED: annexin A6-like [Branchiostoma belcheri]